MRVRSIAGFFLGGATVYFALAACGSSGESGGNLADSGGAADAIIDAIDDTFGLDVPEAEASPTGDTVDTAPCTTTNPGSGSYIQVYAVKEYPGRTTADLMRGTFVVCNQPTGFVNYLSGYSCVTAIAQIRDGAVAVFCGATTAPGDFGATTAMISLPPAP